MGEGSVLSATLYTGRFITCGKFDLPVSESLHLVEHGMEKGFDSPLMAQ